MKIAPILRPMQAADLPVVEEFLYISLWDAPDEPRRPRLVLQHPRVRAYLDGWGREGDHGFLAESVVEEGEEPRAIGAAWCRIKSAVTEEHAGLPELIIGVSPDWEGQGVGAALMQALLEEVRLAEHSGVRLGVHPKNDRARELYERFGFWEYAWPERGYVQMVRLFGG